MLIIVQSCKYIVAKGEIACFEQFLLWSKIETARFEHFFLLLSLCFQKTICCRGVRKRLYEGKG